MFACCVKGPSKKGTCCEFCQRNVSAAFVAHEIEILNHFLKICGEDEAKLYHKTSDWQTGRESIESLAGFIVAG